MYPWVDVLFAMDLLIALFVTRQHFFTTVNAILTAQHKPINVLS